MGSIGIIYEVIRLMLGDKYSNIMYQTMREDHEYDVGIYLYESSNDLEDFDGEEVYNSIKVHVQVNSGKSSNGMLEALDYLEQFTRRIETTQSEIAQFTILSANHLGPRALAVGKNKYDIQVCRSIIDLKYIIR